jgi:hypothetical protein
MKRVIPGDIKGIHTALSTWDPDHDPGMSQEQQTQGFWAYASSRPEAGRRQVNMLRGFLMDEATTDVDKQDFISDATNRRFADPGDAIAWLDVLVDELLAKRRVQRTTTTDGPVPSLMSIYRLRSLLSELKIRLDGLAEPTHAADVLIDWLGDRAGTYAENLLALMNSDHTDRDKADFVVEAAGPFFYSDLEAIEWAAAVARDVLDRLPEHYA